MKKESPYKPIQIKKEIHKELKKIAFDEEITIIELITKLLKHYKATTLNKK